MTRQSLVVVMTVTLGVFIFSFGPQSRSQTAPEIERAALQTAKKVAKTQPHAILTTPLAGCLGVPDLCAEFDRALRSALQKAITDVQFIDREKAVSHLADHGFLSIDAYLGALDVVASDAGAEVVIGEAFRRKQSTCELHITIADSKHLYALSESDNGIPCSLVTTKTMLSLLKDPATGVSLPVAKPRPADAPPVSAQVKVPSCVSCPEPRYTGFARQKGLQGSVQLLITVTEQGTVQDAVALGAVDEGLARASVEAVSGWVLKPATVDGTPFPMRTFVTVTFRLFPR